MTDGTALTGGDIPGTVLSIDAMGGDEGPAAVVGGMAKAIDKNPELRFIVHGDRPELERLIEKRRGLAERCELRHADDVVRMDEKPSAVLRQRQKHLHVVGDRGGARGRGARGGLLRQHRRADADVDDAARKIEGVNRPAIACLWPSRNPSGFNVMLDVGADLRADAEDLLQYALMGASYARNGLDLTRPRVGLLNVGTEDHKGRAEIKVAADLIAARGACRRFRLRGLRRGRRPALRQGRRDRHRRLHRQRRAEDRRRHRADDPRTDGRGVPLFAAQPDRGALAYTSLRRLSKRIDPRRVNGGVFLGLNGTVVKSHGGRCHGCRRRDKAGRTAGRQRASTSGWPRASRRPNMPQRSPCRRTRPPTPPPKQPGRQAQ
jgi:glycerol-3-phosphate acyltransferase PlsX